LRFIGKPPREGINVSETHALAEAGTLVVGVSLIFALFVMVLVFLVELAIVFIPTETEAKLFSSWTPDDLVPIVAWDERVIEARALLGRLTAHWSDSPYTFRLEVTESVVPNAMAFPGGLIVLTTELLDQVESANELAFVLGHELGHFRNRDHLRMLGRTAVIGVFFTTLGSGEGGAGFGVSIADITLRNFSRGQETDADEFGLELVVAEYGHINASWSFFDRMAGEQSQFTDLAVYLSTHPLAGDRSEELRRHARSLGWSVEGPVVELPWGEPGKSKHESVEIETESLFEVRK